MLDRFFGGRSPQEIEEAKARARENLDEMRQEREAGTESALEAKERLKGILKGAVEELKGNEQKLPEVARRLVPLLRADWMADRTRVEQAFYDLEEIHGMPAKNLRKAIEDLLEVRPLERAA